MKNYFEPVEFPELEEPKNELAVIPEDVDLNGDIPRALSESRRLFNALRSGTSNLRRGALQLRAGEPSMVAFQELEKAPTRQRLNRFLLLAKQDMGRVAAVELRKIFVDVDSSLEGKTTI